MACKADPHPEREPGFLGEQSKGARRRASPSISLPLDTVRGEAGAGRGGALGRPDMIPLAVMHDRVAPPGLGGPVIDAVEGKALVGVTLEIPPVRQLEGGEDIGRDLVLGG